MTAPYRLHYAPDNASLIIRLALEELGQPYQTVLVDRGRNDQNSAGFLALNPNGLIPVLETPQGAIFETAAILLWLADAHGALAPAANDPDRGAFLKWLFWTSNTLHADMRMLFYADNYVGPDEAQQAALRAGTRQRLLAHLPMIDTVAADKPSWLSHTAPSVLSLYLACLLRWLALYPASVDRSWFNLADTPHLKRIITRLEARPSVRMARDAEGLGATPFTAPQYPNPPEGTAT